MDWTLPALGLMWGGISALSLPVGALVGLWTKPSRRVTSALMAFGGGALLFALSIELFGHALHVASDAHGSIVKPGIVLATMGSAVVGGLLFALLNQLLNNKGAFLRKSSLIRKHIVKEKRKEAGKLLASLGKVKVLRALPPEEVVKIIPLVERKQFEDGETIFDEGQPGDAVYFIDTGSVSISRAAAASGAPAQLAVLGPTDVFGELALVSDQPRSATAKAQGAVKAWCIHRHDFQWLMTEIPAMGQAVLSLARDRITDLARRETSLNHAPTSWHSDALARLEAAALQPTLGDVREQVKQHGHGGGAALAIWLGIALDGIPESLVIGMLVVSAAATGEGLSLAFIAGVFLANLPEAMSSAVTMQNNGTKVPRIFLMWASLCVMTAVGGMIGALVFPAHPAGWVVYAIYSMEGLAAGAMLTMIAETMLPEAFEQGGGTIVGLSTLTGFLAALAVKFTA
jgi:CRP-like cAMP-binding protein